MTRNLQIKKTPPTGHSRFTRSPKKWQHIPWIRWKRLRFARLIMNEMSSKTKRKRLVDEISGIHSETTYLWNICSVFLSELVRQIHLSHIESLAEICNGLHPLLQEAKVGRAFNYMNRQILHLRSLFHMFESNEKCLIIAFTFDNRSTLSQNLSLPERAHKGSHEKNLQFLWILVYWSDLKTVAKQNWWQKLLYFSLLPRKQSNDRDAKHLKFGDKNWCEEKYAASNNTRIVKHG